MMWSPQGDFGVVPPPQVPLGPDRSMVRDATV